MRSCSSATQVNCLTEIFVERALQRAKELDDHLQRTGEVAGPLHGLPISLKDQICIKGLEATMGGSSRILPHLATRDAMLPQAMPRGLESIPKRMQS